MSLYRSSKGGGWGRRGRGTLPRSGPWCPGLLRTVMRGGCCRESGCHGRSRGVTGYRGWGSGGERGGRRSELEGGAVWPRGPGWGGHGGGAPAAPALSLSGGEMTASMWVGRAPSSVALSGLPAGRRELPGVKAPRDPRGGAWEEQGTEMSAFVGSVSSEPGAVRCLQPDGRGFAGSPGGKA